MSSPRPNRVLIRGTTRHTAQGELEQAKQFLENLHIFHLAESLGSVESLVDFPYGAVSPCSLSPPPPKLCQAWWWWMS